MSGGEGTCVQVIAVILQAGSVIAACVTIILGVGAWKREFIGKRQIELAEQLLAKFFEVSDAIAFVRNPSESSEEGKSRKRGDTESPEDRERLDRGYIVTERYQKRETIFADFNTLKYRCMATFGAETENIFIETDKVVNSIFVSARLLATRYWLRQGTVPMAEDERQKHLKEMDRHEDIFWDTGAEEDEIRRQLRGIQESLEQAIAPCFKEPIKK